MKPLVSRLPFALLVWLFVLPLAALAQDGPRSISVPNEMNIHTWFIIGAVGAFLAWCISYSIQLQKEALTRQKGREDLARQKEEVLNKIVELENRKDSAQITEQQYKHELKELRFRLRKILEKATLSEAQKSAKKTS
jgi:hypothetical protein